MNNRNVQLTSVNIYTIEEETARSSISTHYFNSSKIHSKCHSSSADILHGCRSSFANQKRNVKQICCDRKCLEDSQAQNSLTAAYF